MTPDNLQRYLTQSSYYVPLLSRLGVPQDESLVIGAFLDRQGLGRGKGGTAHQNFTIALMRPAMLTGSRGGAQLSAMKDLDPYDAHGNPNPGIFRSDAARNLVTDPLQALKMIATTIADKTRNLRGPEKAREQMHLIGDFQKAFGIQGQRFGLLGDATGIGRLVGMAAKLPNMPDVEAAQGLFMNTLGGQRQLAFSNFRSMIAAAGEHAIPAATNAMRELGNVFNDGTVWMNTQKRETHSFMVTLDTDVATLGTGIRAHRSDFENLAHDAITAGKAVAGLAEGALLLGSAALTAYGDIHRATAWILKLDPFKTPADQFRENTSLSTQRDVLYKGLRNKHLSLVPGAPQSPLAAFGDWINDVFKTTHHGIGASPFAATQPQHGDPKRDARNHTRGRN